MTKKQVLELLHISNSTLDRRMKDGTYKFTKAAGQFGEVTFTREGLGLPALPEIKLPYQDDPEPTRIRCERKHFIRPTPAIEKKQQEDLAFATAYKMGQATDSFGNRIDGSNDLCRETGAATLVPVPVRDYAAPHRTNTQAHMSSVHYVDTDVPSGNDNPLNPGVDPSTLDAMRFQFSRSVGSPSQSEMAAKAWNDRRNINASFPRGE
jgi:hypothetical protein